jgi:glycosyltransferase involved in cell wall biosynthesis
VNDVRWFAPNAYTALIVGELRKRGLSIAQEGNEPARLALSMSGITALAAWRYARRAGCPLVVYIWDLPPQATGTGTYDWVYSLGSALLRIPRPGGGFGRRRGYYSRLRYIAASAAEVWVPSKFSGELVQRRFGLSTRRVPYCYDSERFRPSAEVRQSPPTLLTVGRFKAHKNHAATIRAASAIGPGIQVVLIGRGPEAAALERLARTNGVSCRVETEVDDSSVARAYHRARVAVCPSRFEGLGLTPLEGIASGTPVVASDIPPHREFVASAARLVPLDDDQALVEAIRRALDDNPPDPGAVRALTIPAAADRFLASLRPLLL